MHLKCVSDVSSAIYFYTLLGAIGKVFSSAVYYCNQIHFTLGAADVDNITDKVLGLPLEDVSALKDQPPVEIQ